MSEELRILREAAEVRCAVLDNEKWVSKPQVFDLPPYEGELPNSNNISNIDKNGTKGEGRGIGGLLRGDFVKRGEFLYWQSRIIEHTAWHKAQAEERAEKSKSIWTNDGHGMDKV